MLKDLFEDIKKEVKEVKKELPKFVKELTGNYIDINEMVMKLSKQMKPLPRLAGVAFVSEIMERKGYKVSNLKKNGLILASKGKSVILVDMQTELMDQSKWKKWMVSSKSNKGIIITFDEVTNSVLTTWKKDKTELVTISAILEWIKKK